MWRLCDITTEHIFLVFQRGEFLESDFAYRFSSNRRALALTDIVETLLHCTFFNEEVFWYKFGSFFCIKPGATMLFHFLSDYEKSGSENYGHRCYRRDYAVQVLKGIWNQRPDNNCYFMFCRSFPFFSPRTIFFALVNSRRLSAFTGSNQGSDIN